MTRRSLLYSPLCLWFLAAVSLHDMPRGCLAFVALGAGSSPRLSSRTVAFGPPSCGANVRVMRKRMSPQDDDDTAAVDEDTTKDSSSAANDDDTDNTDGGPTYSPVLMNVYPALLEHIAEFGHPNIPLGSAEGRACETLRRLHIQQKLSDSDVALLESLEFRFYSLEQVYETANFDELYDRLVAYGKQHDGDVSPPKKYAPDPELGAWVTGIRRKGPNQVDPDHVTKLNAIDFQWTSPRVCGSAFMQQYRALQQRLLLHNDDESDAVWADHEVQTWIRAQQEAAKRGTLSETRKHYMQEILGGQSDWIQLERPWE